MWLAIPDECCAYAAVPNPPVSEKANCELGWTHCALSHAEAQAQCAVKLLQLLMSPDARSEMHRLQNTAIKRPRSACAQ